MKTLAIINIEDHGENETRYVEEKEIKAATISDWLNADFSTYDAGLEEVGENENGETLYRSHAGDFEGVFALEEIENIETGWFCISYWDGNNWQYDIFENYDTEEVEVINRDDLEPNPLYYYVYELIFEDGTKIITTCSNESGSLSPYYFEDKELLEMFEIRHEKIDNTKHFKKLYISEERSAKIIECLEYDSQEFFQTLINEFVVEYDSNVMTEEIILKLQECKSLAEKLVI